METNGAAANPSELTPGAAPFAPLLHSLDSVGRSILRFIRTAEGLVAFALITLGVAFGKFNASAGVIHPLVRTQVHRAGVQLLAMTSFLACALGLVIIGQMVALLSRVGAQGMAGTVMVTVVVRELGPLVAALLVLARVGAGYVIELGTARAMGEVEALEALCIDPIHYLVVPRVTGLALSIFSLTVYFIIVALVSGYLFAFVQDVPLTPGDYFKQLAVALAWEDFALLALKTCSFGAVIAVVTCYQGLARPLRLEEVSGATTRAVVQSVVGCVLLDICFIVVYLVM
ncbi:MAG TPA: ABC transporter permease [Verrucomicrobiae bacterium]|nr:ABC transporter permease [Verrucomicrobiae bacterium]